MPWQTITLNMPSDFIAAPAENIEIVAEPWLHAPSNFVDSNGYNVHVKSRWSEDWERAFGHYGQRIVGIPLPAPAIYAQLWGFRGYRFEGATGVICVIVPDESLLTPIGNEPRRVVWVADNEACFGYGYRTSAGQVKFLLRMSRLALRYSTQEELLLSTEDAQPLVRLPRTSAAYDLDYARQAAIPFQAATIRIASGQAAVLAKSEIGRLTLDEKIQPLGGPDFQAEQHRLAPYLSNASKPRSQQASRNSLGKRRAE